MTTTKQKILSQSLHLFNTHGIPNVSLRMIADQSGISVGNLQYHFKKREDIIEALYFQLVENLNKLLVPDKEDLLASFFYSAEQMITTLYAYSFFLLDFVTIVRKNPKIKAHYREVSALREQQFLMVIHLLIELGLLRKERLIDQYKTLYKQIEVISNFWFSSILIQSDSLSKDSIKKFTFIVCQSIYPYLTKKGRKKYAEYFPEQPI